MLEDWATFEWTGILPMENHRSSLVNSHRDMIESASEVPLPQSKYVRTRKQTVYKSIETKVNVE